MRLGGRQRSEPHARAGGRARPAGSSRSGSPFDQPGLGVRTGDAYTGFDVDTAIYIAGALGVTRDNITWKEANATSVNSCWSPAART